MTRIKIALAIFGILLFALLGIKWMDAYSLWDDEANTALFAQSVHETGDTSAIIGHNVIAYRNGAELNENKKSRYVSPLQYYFLAPFTDAHRPNPFQSRLPFFLLTLLSLAIIYRRLIKLNLRTPLLFSFFLLSFGLTSFLLFGIQSRYYALTFFFTLLLSEQYWFSKIETKVQAFRFGLMSALLFISNYLVGVAVLVSLLAHTLFIKKEKLNHLWTFLIPHLFVSLPVFLIWNPLGKKVVEMRNSPLDKLNLLYRNIRDFNGGHLGSLLLLISGVFLFEKHSQNRFKEYGLIFIVYLATISAFSPQPVHGTGLADIRYLYPLMILSFAWTLDFFNLTLTKNKYLFATTVFVFAFFSLPYSGQFRFHAVELLNEVRHPADDPYQLVSTELNKIQMIEGEHPTLLSSLDYATYPLMYSSPQFQYIQSEPQKAPEYIVEFCDNSMRNALEIKFTAQYEEIASIHSVCRETFRPEVFLRSFARNQKQGTIGVYKRSSRHTH